MKAPRCGHYFCATCWTGQVLNAGIREFLGLNIEKCFIRHVYCSIKATWAITFVRTYTWSLLIWQGDDCLAGYRVHAHGHKRWTRVFDITMCWSIMWCCYRRKHGIGFSLSWGSREVHSLSLKIVCGGQPKGQHASPLSVTVTCSYHWVEVSLLASNWFCVLSKVVWFSRSSGALLLTVTTQLSFKQALVLMTLSASAGPTFAGT